jgi:hypothetical protein
LYTDSSIIRVTGNRITMMDCIFHWQYRASTTTMLDYHGILTLADNYLPNNPEHQVIDILSKYFMVFLGIFAPPKISKI